MTENPSTDAPQPDVPGVQSGVPKTGRPLRLVAAGVLALGGVLALVSTLSSYLRVDSGGVNGTSLNQSGLVFGAWSMQLIQPGLRPIAIPHQYGVPLAASAVALICGAVLIVVTRIQVLRLLALVVAGMLAGTIWMFLNYLTDLAVAPDAEAHQQLTYQSGWVLAIVGLVVTVIGAIVLVISEVTGRKGDERTAASAGPGRAAENVVAYAIVEDTPRYGIPVPGDQGTD